MLNMERKHVNPVEDKSLIPSIQLYFEFQKLKFLYRQGWLKSKVPECESVADHCFGVAILALLLNKEMKLGYDTEKIIILSLIHELGEIYLGDITPHDNISKKEKHRLEFEATKKALSHLPNSTYYLSLWLEFENDKTPEARFIKQLDKLEMALQAKTYEASFSLNLASFFESADIAISSEKLKQILQSVTTKKQ